MSCLASSGDEVKIWDPSTYSLIEQFNPFERRVSDLCWSHDGSLLAACCDKEKKVNLYLSKGFCIIPSESFELPSSCTCIDFSSNSQNILCGCADGSVHLWDRRNKAIRKSYKDHKFSITAVRWNWNDTSVAVGSSSGKIFLCNVITGQVSRPFAVSKSEAIRQLKYNPYHKSSLVSVSDDCKVSMWDTNTRHLVHAFSSAHQAPPTDLAFSPINDCLMVSVGLDKRVALFDIQSKSPINTIVADYPLTSVDMKDGITVTVGSTRGNLFVYDMRKASSPILNIAAHSSSIGCVSFANKDTNSDTANVPEPKLQVSSIPVTSPSSRDFNHSNNVTMRNAHNFRDDADFGFDQAIFSPLREGNRSNSLIDRTESELSWTQVHKSVNGDTNELDYSIFSPVKNQSSLSMNKSSVSMNNTSDLMDCLGKTALPSFVQQLLDPTENSAAFEQSTNVPSKMPSALNSSLENIHLSNASLHQQDGGSSAAAADASLCRTPPRNLYQKGVGASPSMHKISPARNDIDKDQYFTSVMNNVTPSPASSSHKTKSSPKRISPSKSLNNGSSPSASPRPHHAQSSILQEGPVPNGVNNPTSRVGDPSSQHLEPLFQDSISQLKHIVRDLLKEQFQAHKDVFRTELKAMMSQASSNSQTPCFSDQAHAGKSEALTPHAFQTEFIKNLIHEEFQELREQIHSECLYVKLEVIRQVFQLQKKLDAGLAECGINPLLLDEICRLREENEILRKTY